MSDVETTMEVSDEEVKSSRDRVQELREELAAVNAELTVTEKSRDNAVRKVRLDREAESLERQLENARRRLEVSRESTSSLADATDDEEGGGGGTGGIPGLALDEADVNTETGEVNADEVERLTSTDASDTDEDKE